MKVNSEIHRFDEKKGVAAAATPPASWYVEKEFHDLDEKVLKTHWQFVGHTGQLPHVGSYISGEFGGEPYVVVKTPSGEIKSFFNVCRHHASRLVDGEGRVSTFVCPYHAWTYSLDGELKRAPHMENAKDFSCERLSLRPLPLRIWHSFILVNFSGQDSPLDPEWEVLSRHLTRTQSDRLHFVGRHRYELACNWKVYVDNYLDGGYHVAHLHRGLASQLDLKGYRIELFSNWVLQACGGANEEKKSIRLPGDAPANLDFRDRIGDEALYAWLHPNFMINRYGNIMDTNWVIPLAPDRCATIFDYYFLEPDKTDFIASSLKASEQVQIEDIGICEAVQKGLASSAYGTGRYAPGLEAGAYLFHSLLKRDYLSFTETGDR